MALTWTFAKVPCFPLQCNCELMHIDSLVLQPMATITSASYLFLGMYLYFHYKDRILSKLLMVTGFSSIFMHASFTNLARTFDFLSIFLVSAWIFYQLQSHFKNKMLIFITLVFIPSLALIILPNHPFLITALTFIPSAVVTFLNRKNLFIKRSLIFSALACLSFYLDQHRLLCFEDFKIHGHSLWHIFTAISVYCYFLAAKK